MTRQDSSIETAGASKSNGVEAMAVAESPLPTTATAPKNPFEHLGRRRRVGWLLFTLLAIALAAGAVWTYRTHAARPAPRFITATVTRGDVGEAIETTGTIQPVLQVQVSSQVSGRIARVLVDFNSVVHRGDLLAELDTTPIRAQLEQARGSLLAAQGNLTRAQSDFATNSQAYERAVALRQRNLNAVVDVETARGARDSARGAIAASQGAVAQARAQLAAAQANLEYAQIRSPIDGVVISRSVDPGQTVAASLQAPVLFLIANDMSQMRVLADVQESFIGQLHAGSEAEIRVDAFRGEVFRGRVREVRYNATTTSGVVTYPAVIDVDNPEGKLRPGMTATVHIATAQHDNVLRVPNAALRFRPSTGASQGGRGGAGGGGARQARNADPNAGRVFVLRNGQPVPVRVRVGITDGSFTEVEGEGLGEGTTIVVEQTDAASDAPRGNRPSGASNPMGGPSGGARMPRRM
jgi:HlyD family secretion protein